MRRVFADEILMHAKENPNIVLLTADLGYKLWDEFAEMLPRQFINCGASEQCMLDVSVGLALSGKVPFCYTITPFLIYRPFETIRTYLSREKLHVILMGSGRDKDYELDGFSHNASDVGNFLRILKIKSYFPKRKDEIPMIVNEVLKNPGAAFVSLQR